MTVRSSIEPLRLSDRNGHGLCIVMIVLDATAFTKSSKEIGRHQLTIKSRGTHLVAPEMGVTTRLHAASEYVHKQFGKFARQSILRFDDSSFVI